jgi:hypothetical protein
LVIAVDILAQATTHGTTIAKRIAPIINSAPAARRAEMIERSHSYFKTTVAAPVADLTKDGATPWEVQEFRDAATMTFDYHLSQLTLERN